MRGDIWELVLPGLDCKSLVDRKRSNQLFSPGVLNTVPVPGEWLLNVGQSLSSPVPTKYRLIDTEGLLIFSVFVCVKLSRHSLFSSSCQQE